VGYCQPISDEYVEKKLFRKKWWKPGQLRTFYAWLGHQVQLKDLLFEGPYFQGRFFPANADLAYYYPMMEMAGTHYKYIPDIIYIRNVATPLNDFKANKEVQILGSKLLREKPKYVSLEKPMDLYFSSFEEQNADLIFFSENWAHASRMIRSCEKLVHNLDTLYLVHQSAQKEFESISSEHFNIVSISIQQENFKDCLLDVLDKANHQYILFACDGMVFNHYVNCAECILALEKTFSYGFLLGLGITSLVSHQNGMQQPLPPLNQINDSMYAWAFHYADSGDWRRYNNLAATLYRTNTVIEQFKELSFANYHELFEQWSMLPINLEQVGLCYEAAHIGYVNWY